MNADSKSDFIVHCGSCAWEWIAAELPLTVERFAESVAVNGECPNCGWGPTLCGPAPATWGKVG